MTTASFEVEGGKLSAEVTLSSKRDGSYDLRLWHRDLNSKMREWSGNFINSDDDRFDLPTPVASNDGRLLQALVVLAVPTGVAPCTISLVVHQGETEIGRDSRDVPPGSVDELAQLWVELRARSA